MKQNSLNIYRTADRKPPVPLLGQMVVDQYKSKERRGLTTTSGEPSIDTDNLVNTFVDYLGYNASMSNVGTRFLAAENNVKVPKVTGKPGLIWHTEATSDLTDDTGLTIGKAELDFKTWSTKIIKLSREWVEDAGELGQRMIDSAIRVAVDDFVSETILRGSGSGQPYGIDNLVGKLTYASTGIFSVQLYDDFIRAAELLLAQNVPLDRLSVVYGNNTWKLLNLLKDDYGSYLTPPDFWMNINKLRTGAVDESYGTPDTTRVYMGDFSNVIWYSSPKSPVRIDILEKYSDSLQVAVIVYGRADIVYLRPDNLLLMTGVSLQET